MTTYKEDWRKDDSKDGLLLLITGVIMVVVTGLVLKRELNPEWAKYQREFAQIVSQKLGPKQAEKTPGGKMLPFGSLNMEGFGHVQQIWLPELKVTDRCTTCHLGMNYGPKFAKKNLKKEHHIYQSHPNPFIREEEKDGKTVEVGLMDIHKIEDYGCTTCHMGQGVATNFVEAHVVPNKDGHKPRWLYPVLTEEIGKEYKFDQTLKNPPDWLGEKPSRLPMTEVQCNNCHRRDVEVKGMPFINKAKKMIWGKEQICLTCHSMDGTGGNIGPELTYEGDKSHEAFDTGSDKPFIIEPDAKKKKEQIQEKLDRRELFTKNHLPVSVFSWHLLHFDKPASMSKGTAMPDLGLSLAERQALTMYMMSLRKVKLPLQYIPSQKGDLKSWKTTDEVKSSMGAAPEASEEAAAPVAVDPVAAGQALFDGRGCKACHNLTDVRLVGPGLKGVVGRRDEEWLKKWLKDPPGMLASDPIAMELAKEYPGVLMPPTGFSDAEIDQMIAFLKEKAK